MPRALHATRYIREGAEELVRIVSDNLHGYDLDEALDFYNRFNAWSTDERDTAFLAANDRFFLLAGLLNRRDAINPFVYDRCREVENEPDGCLDLWARWHFKSTTITNAGAIQEIIRDPEITIGLFSHTRDIARAFLRQIMQEAETNQALITAFPDVFWPKPRIQAPKWSEADGITVIRKGNPKEATVEAWGLVDGQPTSKHFKLLIYDDVVTLKSVTTPEMVKKTTAAWELSDNLGVGEKTRKWHIGTRYSYSDTYQTLIDRKLFKVRLYPATHNGRLDGRPVLMTPAEWEKVKKTQRSTVAAQMLQNPAAGTQAAFDLAWLKPYEIRPSLLNIYIMVDASGGKRRTSDRTAMAVIGVDISKNKYLLDGFRHRMKLSERWENLKALYEKWSKAPGVQSIEVGYERYGMQSDIEYMQEKMIDFKAEFPIRELNWTQEGVGQQGKVSRVTRLQPDIEGAATKFYFPSIILHDEWGLCSWKYDPEHNQIAFNPCEVTHHLRGADGELREVRTGDVRQTRLQSLMDKQGQPWRKARAIKRIDEEGLPYDLTRAFFEEIQFFPFRIGHDDLIDAASRIYDMDYSAPMPLDRLAIETPEFTDG